jgi:hypothetical protein
MISTALLSLVCNQPITGKTMHGEGFNPFWYPKPPLEGFGIGCHFYSQKWAALAVFHVWRQFLAF